MPAGPVRRVMAHGAFPCHARHRTAHGLGCPPVNWFFSGLLIVTSAGIAAFTGYLLRRLFTTEPGTPDVTREVTP
ncbi:hypothetical protein GCM10009610_19850 [Pseudonocardia xinjiangensis]